MELPLSVVETRPAEGIREWELRMGGKVVATTWKDSADFSTPSNGPGTTEELSILRHLLFNLKHQNDPDTTRYRGV